MGVSWNNYQEERWAKWDEPAIKKALAASTMSQIGYMMLAVGLGPPAYAIGILHLLTHGIQDPMLPVDWACHSRDTLQTLGVDLEYHEFNMGHQVTAESLSVIATWLEKQLKK